MRPTETLRTRSRSHGGSRVQSLESRPQGSGLPAGASRTSPSIRADSTRRPESPSARPRGRGPAGYLRQGTPRTRRPPPRDPNLPAAFSLTWRRSAPKTSQAKRKVRTLTFPHRSHQRRCRLGGRLYHRDAVEELREQREECWDSGGPPSASCGFSNRSELEMDHFVLLVLSGLSELTNLASG